MVDDSEWEEAKSSECSDHSVRGENHSLAQGLPKEGDYLSRNYERAHEGF